MWRRKMQHENTDEYIIKRGDKPNDESHKNNAREMETMEHTQRKEINGVGVTNGRVKP